ncbi:heat shock 70 kDa protein 12A-like [Saccostrea cucullata]|uniref:heat shock 70 kDa protein 12A-like n=1 Tax=Saccostrea cuccullata TaxID=36930 RepID=UPI002ED28FC0
MGEYFTILKEFENKKRSINPDFQMSFVTKLPAILNQNCSDQDKMKAIQASYLKDQVKIVKDKVKISARMMMSFFEDSLSQTKKHVMEILQTVTNIEHILIVGGYGECSLLQETFKKEFSNKNIVIPNECSLAVIKGAVLFGHDPMAISSRILRYSYGPAVHAIFDSTKHPEEKRYIDKKGIERCNDAFDQLIARDTKVPSSGKTLTHTAVPLYDDQKGYVLRLYCTEENGPAVIKDNFQLVGKLNVSVPEYIQGKWEAEEHYTFGMTEIKVSSTVKETGETFETSFDLLE